MKPRGSVMMFSRIVPRVMMFSILLVEIRFHRWLGVYGGFSHVGVNAFFRGPSVRNSLITNFSFSHQFDVMPPGGVVFHQSWLSHNFSNSFPPDYIGNDSLVPPFSDISTVRAEYQNFSLRIHQFTDFHVNGQCTMIRDGVVYHRCSCQAERIAVRTFRGEYEHVLIVCHDWEFNYDHFTHDMLMWLLMLPPDLLSKIYFVLKRVKPFARESLNWFGLGSRVIGLGRDQYITARFVYSFDPYPCRAEHPVVVLKYRKFIVDKFDLDHNISRDCAWLNRKPFEARYLGNMEEIMKLAQQKYPEFTWKQIWSTASIEQNARMYNPLLLYTAVHGAASVNILYMQPGTVHCEIQTDISPYYFFNLSRVNGMHYVTARVPGMKHFRGSSGSKACTLDLNVAGEMIKTGVKYLSRWSETGRRKDEQ